LERISIVERVRPHLHLPDEQIARLLGISPRSARDARRKLKGSTTGWTAEAKAWVIEQARGGVSPPDLVGPLLDKFGIIKTANALVGLVYRVGISVRATRPRPAASAEAASVALHAVEALHDKACRWPEGDPASPGFHFCLAPKLVGRPYCRRHFDMAYARPGARREAA
jgi:GcrA cell cycle regulator